MKRSFVLHLIVLFFATMALAQTQQGLVKTKGRMASNGTVITGTRISGATVQVKGRTSVLSQSNGTFSFPIPAQNFYLQNVQKQGYVLTDPDVLSKQYAYSKNPLVLVLETPSQQAEDKIAALRKIRKTLQKQLQEKEDEIESLKAQQKLSEEDYRKQLQEIYAQQENNEKLIGEMADRYSRMDFDEVDEFNRRISQLILDGKLTEADSLINAKGDINTRATVLRQHQEANAQAEQEIKKRQKKLEKSKAMTQKELEDLAQDCYSKFEIFKMQHLNDSAAFYIEFRAALDTTNIDFQNQAGEYVRDYSANYEKAISFHKRALQLAISNSNDNSAIVAKIYNNLGGDVSQIGNIDLAKSYYEKAISYYLTNDSLYDLDLASVYDNYGSLYWKRMSLDTAYYYVDKALEIRKQHSNKYISKDLALSYNNLGNICMSKGEFNASIDYFEKSIELWKSLFGDSNENVALVYNSIGMTYKNINKPDTAINYFLKAIEIGKIYLGNTHPDIGLRYNNLGAAYDDMGVLDSALVYYNKALDIILPKRGKNTGITASLYGNIGNIYLKRGDFDTSLKYVLLSTDIDISLYGEDNPNVAIDYANMSAIYSKKGDKEKAIQYAYKAYNIFLKKLGEEHPYTKTLNKKISEIKEQ